MQTLMPVELHKKSPVNAKRNAQQQCMFESLNQSNQTKPKSVTRGRQTTGVLLVLTRECDLSHSANAVSAENRKFCLPPLI